MNCFGRYNLSRHLSAEVLDRHVTAAPVHHAVNSIKLSLSENTIRTCNLLFLRFCRNDSLGGEWLKET